MELTGLKSAPRLNFETRGECVYSALITGGSSTLEDARVRVRETQVLLTSGNLPAKATIESKSTTPPALGMKFLDYSVYIGVIALITVAFIILLRYRRLDISLSIMATDVSEVLIVLGFAAMISWNMDLASVAGIIAAVGTGVNDQIVMTDEAMMQGKRRRDRKEFFSVADQIKRAFFIIFTAAATIVAAMIPILSIGAGMLKGFAFTTIMGVLFGIIITRPGYAEVLRELLKK
jgi:preprotein translocase subunit SecD